jgi:hypothetical protein
MATELLACADRMEKLAVEIARKDAAKKDSDVKPDEGNHVAA